MPAKHLDAAMDRLNMLKNAIEARLTADDVPRLNDQLAEIFEEFKISKSTSGEGLGVTPRLKREWLAEQDRQGATPRVINFSDNPDGGVGVLTEYPPAVLRRLDVSSPGAADEVNGNS